MSSNELNQKRAFLPAGWLGLGPCLLVLVSAGVVDIQEGSASASVPPRALETQEDGA